MKIDVFPSCSHHVPIISNGLTDQDRTLYMRLGPRNDRDRDVAGGMREKKEGAQLFKIPLLIVIKCAQTTVASPS